MTLLENNNKKKTCRRCKWQHNINSTSKGRDLLLVNKPLIVPWGTERSCKGSRGTAELLYLHYSYFTYTLQYIRNESKTRRKNLAMAWIDNKKVYDVVPQSWIINCLKMYKISHEVINFMEKTIKTWRVELTAGRRSLQSPKTSKGDENRRKNRDKFRLQNYQDRLEYWEESWKLDTCGLSDSSKSLLNNADAKISQGSW